ncbi:hypothetical protein ABE444_04085 [Brevundimonas pondensis]|jgi:hypothetical protein|uniref:hypothetical protein n=1 Tax=Brevundimonas TaxID=41275 RepID=UPI0012FA51DF|nr:hypothetical protein [Brevundimonas diminuta]
MTIELDAFVRRGQQLAAAHGLAWDLPWDPTDGGVPRGQRWDLAAIAKDSSGRASWLSSFAAMGSAAEALQTLTGATMPAVMGAGWIELYKAIALHDLLVKNNRPQNFESNIGPSFRILAGCAGDVSPANLGADQVQLAFNVALLSSPSAKRASTLRALIAVWFDTYNFAKHRPLAQYCEAYPNDASLQAQAERLVQVARRQTDKKRPAALRSKLSDRHFEEQLPDERALAELVRIVFSEQPKTTSDLVRFHQIRLLIITGFRIGELALLPSSTLVTRSDALPHPRIYGAPEPATALVHFAEKQRRQGTRQDLVEEIHHVPSLLAPAVRDSVATVLRATSTQRAMLKRQIDEQRLFVGLADEDLVPWTDAYGRMSGMMQVSQEPVPDALKERYRAGYDVRALAAIREHQDDHVMKVGPNKQVREYFLRAERALGRPLLRRADGSVFSFAPRERNDDRGVYVLARDMETYAKLHLRTKLPDERIARSGDRELGSQDFLFLFAGRALAEDKHDAVIDIERYFSVQRADVADLERQLGGKNPGVIFEKYGGTQEARSYSVNPHSLRHYQTTELFKLGVADTIITKRFNRKTTAQSYVYDHRSVSERLEEMEPAQAKLADEVLGPQARQALDLIRGRKIQGPIVKRFLEIQKTHDDKEAFEYLNAEANALHITPYGFCLNSFAASPCLKHLECFNACSHLVRTDSPVEQANLDEMKGRYELHIRKIRASPSEAPGYTAQLGHAEARLAGIEMALAQKPGAVVFPDGKNRYLAPQ